MFALALYCNSTSMASEPAASPRWLAGAAKVDVTPREPLRLSGYANRERPSEGVADHLFVRALSLRAENLGPEQRVVLVSIDTIGVPATFTHAIAQQVEQRWGIPRSQLVLCCTHSHTAPQLAGALTNILTVPLSEAEAVATTRYTTELRAGVLQAMDAAIANERPATLEIGEGAAGFAANRRVIQNHRWQGFGVAPNGPRSTRVPVLCARDTSTGKPMAISYLYACHCTTMGPEINVVSGDWAGLSATVLETEFPGAIALPVIGCGADINPEPRASIDLARQHGNELAQSVSQVLSAGEAPSKLQSLSPQPIDAHFGYAGLAPERPSIEELTQALNHSSVHRRRWARQLLDITEKMDRIPETYPAPIHTWVWGDQLTWVFLGGEVVIDYQLRLERELPGTHRWVAAYTDDVFGYVASERVRNEGGYEVDDSMIYYSQPGRWQSGTEELLVRRIHEVLQESSPENRPLEPDAALRSFAVPPGFRMELVACEPLVKDPINIAFDHRGRLWVVEMGDYPLGNESQGGTVKILTDPDGDGRFDQATVFLEGLPYPTGVFPWRDGAVVSCAPEVFFARDRDGDGRADERRTLLEGFPLVNPQHRVSGFTYGLDHRLYFGTGEAAEKVRGPGLAQELAISGRDLALDVETGVASTASGSTQFLRGRDDWGNWFGNSNSEPGFHYVLEDSDLRGAGASVASATQSLYEPAWSPPVFPLSRTVDRFNDLHTANSFTSACSGIVSRIPALRVAAEEIGSSASDTFYPSYLVCEPVHNLVHRSALVPDGASFTAVRTKVEQQSEFLRSSDPWSRPVRVENGPDGCLWVVDMYRQVIEHPEWIPLSWQAQLDLRAGADRGRIYRLVPDELDRPRLPTLAENDGQELVESLSSPIGPLRDLAQQQLIWRGAKDSIDGLRKLLRESPFPETRAQALATLVGLSEAGPADWEVAFQDADPRMLRLAVNLMPQGSEPLQQVLAPLAQRARQSDEPALALSVLLALARARDGQTRENAIDAIAQHVGDPWIRTALPLLDASDRATLLAMIQRRISQSPPGATDLAAQETLAGLVQSDAHVPAVRTLIEQLADTRIAKAGSSPQSAGEDGLIVKWLRAAEPWQSEDVPGSVKKWLDWACTQALDKTVDPEWRAELIGVLGSLTASRAEDAGRLIGLLTTSEADAIRVTALRRLGELAQPETGAAMLDAWPDVAPEIRSAAIQLLTQRKAWRDHLAEALQNRRVELADLDPSAVAAIRETLPKEVWESAAGGTPEGSDPAGRAALVDHYLASLSGPGDVARGQALYQQHCAACHASQEGRPPIGPPLEALTDRSPQALLTSILDPSRAIEARYRQASLLTVDGRLLRGVLVQEQSHAIILGLPDGSRETVDRGDIEHLSPMPGSLMPEGFEVQISPLQCADLLAFLQQLRR